MLDVGSAVAVPAESITTVAARGLPLVTAPRP